MDINNEIWLPAIKYKGRNYTGFYEVSNFGRIKSLYRKGARKNDHPKILNQSLDKHGYPHVHLCMKGISKYETVHSLVCNAFNANVENKPEVNHKNGNKTDNSVLNLEWATTSENQIHAFKSGLHISCKGEKHGRSVLKNSDILEIRESKETRKALSIRYRVNIRTIFSILSREKWSHI